MKSIFFLVSFFISNQLFAQQTIEGKVLENGKKPILGASITVKDTYDGTVTDSSGNFKFSTEEKGAQIIEISGKGYEMTSISIKIDSNSINLGNISLKKIYTDIEAVTITAGTFEASDKKQGTVLSSLDVVTTASSQGDVTGALKTLPGTQQVGESEGLFVRGGSETESKIFIDGNLVNNFFYSSKPGIASRGRFNPFLFKGTQFSAGGYSALYGQALSSALILETNDIAENSEGALNISIIGVGGGLQKLAKNKKSSFGVSYNYANLKPAFALIKQEQEYQHAPEYHDADFNFRIKTKNGLVKFYSYFSANKLRFTESDIDSASLRNGFGLNNTNTYNNVLWTEKLPNKWKLSVGLSAGTDATKIANQLEDNDGQKQNFQTPSGYQFKNYDLASKSLYLQGRTVLEKRLRGLSAIRFGAEHFFSKEKVDYTLYNGQVIDNNIKNNLTAAFAEWDFYLTNKLAAKIGNRAEHDQNLNRWNWAPRLSLAQKLSKTSQVSLAYGIFYQSPERRYLPTQYDVDFSKATHYIAQFQHQANNRLLRTEVFYKKYNSLYETGMNNNGQQVIKNNDGTGYADGFELFWRDKKTFKNFDYWVSYSYLDTKRKYLDFPKEMIPNFASKHTASLVMKSFFLPIKTGFNLSYTYASGRPYYQMIHNGNTTTIGDNGTTKSFNNLSFSLNYLPFLGKQKTKSFSVLVLMINNVLGFENVYGYNYGTINNNKVPIIPISKRFVFVGWFWSFGVDRTDDAINNNL